MSVFDAQTLLDEANKYLSFGATVLPAKDKRVLIEGWSKLSGEDAFDDKYKAFWSSATGLGFLCGEVNDTICLDLDLDLINDKDLIDEIRQRLPPILSGKIGNPNRPPSQFFKWNGEKSVKFKNLGVEILSTGNQTIIPPSKHPDFDKKYEWVGTPIYQLSDIDNMPVLPDGFLEWLHEKNLEAKVKKPNGNGHANGIKKGISGRCHSGSHNTISALAVALIHQNYPFDRLLERVMRKDSDLNYDADYFYFNCPSRSWKHNSPLENAKDFVEEIFKNYGPDGKNVASISAEIDYGFERTSRGAIIENVANVFKFLSLNPKYQNKIYFDSFQKRIFFDSKNGKREWTDQDDLHLSHRLQCDHDMRNVSDLTVSKAVRVYADKNRINSVTKYFEGLKWDGSSRIERYFVDYMGAEDNEYVRCAGKNFFISMVARAYKPGCKVDNMVILEGPQGQKKSTANSMLVGDHVFSEISESIDSKDFLLSLQGKLLVEIAELDSFSKTEMTKVKQVITNRIDRFRPPYGRVPVDNPRTCVFVGTTNEDNYLNDVTGGRRFWPIKINEINLEAIDRDRGQLFAEAVSLYKAGSTWWTMPERLTAEVQEDRRVVDEFEIIIQDYLRDKVEVTLWGVAFAALNIDKQRLDLGTQRRIGRCLRANGFRCINRRDGSSVTRVWVVENPKMIEVCSASVSANVMFPRSN